MLFQVHLGYGEKIPHSEHQTILAKATSGSVYVRLLAERLFGSQAIMSHTLSELTRNGCV